MSTTARPIFTIASAPAELKAGLDAICGDRAKRFRAGGSSWQLSFTRDSQLGTQAFAVAAAGRALAIRYGSLSCAFRALGRLLAADAAELATLNVTERSALDMRGLMIDCSRNAVMAPEALQQYLRCVALMGVNMVMLYTEDTYEVPGEPWFGYLRGRYTQAELKAIDDYAAALGIEMIPCIQALAHLEQVLQWDPCFYLRDTNHILLSGDEKTYEFIRKLVRAASAPFRTKRIHVGMDEAHGLGSGNYRLKFGDRPPFDIINEHLARVKGICEAEGLTPMIWSDMYFRLGSKTHDYYDLNWQIPESALKNVPRGVQLVYWDYYHADPEFYRKMIANHRKLGSEPLMGGGIWTWNTQWCQLPWAFTAVKACMTACRQEGLKEVFMTMWGDDGNECDQFSALPGIQYFCELAFNPEATLESAARQYRGACGCDWAPWVRAADINSVPLIKQPEQSWSNVAAALMWQDPFLALFDPHTSAMDLEPHYTAIAKELTAAAKAGGLAQRLLKPAKIAAVLQHKVNLHRRLQAAYRAGDKAAVKALRDNDLKAVRKAVVDLWKFHRAQWMETNHAFGWEVLEHRYGGLLLRLDTARDRLSDWLAGRIDAIPELAEEKLNPWAHVKDTVVGVSFSRVKTPSCIK